MRCRTRPANLTRSLAAGATLALAISLRPEAILAGLAFGIVLLGDRKARCRVLLAWTFAALLLLGTFAISPDLLPLRQVHHNLTGPGFDLQAWLHQRLDYGVALLAGWNPWPENAGRVPIATGCSFVLVMFWLGVLAQRKADGPGWAVFWLPLTGLLVALLIPILLITDSHLPQPAGLLATCPVLLLLGGKTRDPAERNLLNGSLLFVILTLLTAPNAGGLQVGPRYLLIATLPLMLLAARRLRDALATKSAGRRRWLGRVALILTVLAQATGFVQVVQADGEKDRALHLLSKLNPDAYATSNGYLPCELSNLITRKPFYFIPDPRHPEALAKVMLARGERRLVVIGRLPRRPPRAAVYFASYRLLRIMPLRLFPYANLAAWIFAAPGE